MFVPNFKILSQVVSEKSLTEKKFTDTQANIRTEKAKTIYPLYTSYAGGINMKISNKQQITCFTDCTDIPIKFRARRHIVAAIDIS